MTTESKKWLRFRLATLLLCFLVLFIALITRAFQIQVLNGQSLKIRADRQHTTTLRSESERGIVFDRNGEKLAASIMADSVCADPSKVVNLEETAGKIASLLDIDKGTILKKFSGSGPVNSPIAWPLTPLPDSAKLWRRLFPDIKMPS